MFNYITMSLLIALTLILTLTNCNNNVIAQEQSISTQENDPIRQDCSCVYYTFTQESVDWITTHGAHTFDVRIYVNDTAGVTSYSVHIDMLLPKHYQEENKLYINPALMTSGAEISIVNEFDPFKGLDWGKVYVDNDTLIALSGNYVSITR